MAGFSKSGLDRMHRVLSGYVERGDIPGIVALVARHDDVHFDVLGDVKRDSIFRIASLSKPITAVAAMILVEECKLRLDEPIDPWLPELADRRVLKSISSEIDDTIPANRSVTLRDLLTYRMGFGSVMAAPNTYPVQKLIRELKIGGDGPPLPAKLLATDEWLKNLGTLPLMAQPGEKWLYHVSGDVLGALISRVAGMSLGEFLRERIFDPLGMKDTGFFVPAEKLDRFTKTYVVDRKNGGLKVFDGAEDSAWGSQPPFESGGGGLVSTVDDHLAFSQMMLNKGGKILSRTSVELMTSEQITPAQRDENQIFFGGFSGWGFGVAVDIRRDHLFHNPGRFGWTGGLGTTAYVDPAEGLVGILFTERCMDSPEPPRVFQDFWTTTYAALE